MPTFRAVVMCEHCTWRAKMSGDTPLEVAEFLRKTLIEHVQSVHPDKPTSGDA